MKKVFKLMACAIVVVLVLGLGGRSDWSDQVICAMPQTAYDVIAQKLGDDCTEYDIAKEYMSNKAYYDALGY